METSIILRVKQIEVRDGNLVLTLDVPAQSFVWCVVPVPLGDCDPSDFHFGRRVKLTVTPVNEEGA